MITNHKIQHGLWFYENKLWVYGEIYVSNQEFYYLSKSHHTGRKGHVHISEIEPKVISLIHKPIAKLISRLDEI